MELAIIIAVVVVALVFDYTNGFHDAANAIATSVSTRALTPRVALLMAAVMNFVGAFLGQKVAKTVSEVIEVPTGSTGLVIVMSGLIGAITWNIITWYYGLPSSSSHALIGGLAGATVAHAGFGAFRWSALGSKVLVPLVGDEAVHPVPQGAPQIPGLADEAVEVGGHGRTPSRTHASGDSDAGAVGELGVEGAATTDDLYERAEIITLHLPKSWPWQAAWTQMFNPVSDPPPALTT